MGQAPRRNCFLRFFKTKSAHYASKLKGDSPAARAKWLARLRDNEGYMADFSDEGALRIIEHHSPILDLLRAFPIVARLESEMFQRVLRMSVTREESAVSRAVSLRV